MTLYEILHGYREVSDRIDSYGGEVPEDLELQLSKIEASLDDKIDGFCALRREWEADANTAREEAKRLQALAQVKQNAADRLWNELKYQLGLLGVKSHKTRRFHVYFAMSQSIKVDCDPQSLPEAYRRVKYEADKVALGAANKEGLALPPGVSVEQTVGLRLK